MPIGFYFLVPLGLFALYVLWVRGVQWRFFNRSQKSQFHEYSPSPELRIPLRVYSPPSIRPAALTATLVALGPDDWELRWQDDVVHPVSIEVFEQLADLRVPYGRQSIKVYRNGGYLLSGWVPFEFGV